MSLADGARAALTSAQRTPEHRTDPAMRNAVIELAHLVLVLASHVDSHDDRLDDLHLTGTAPVIPPADAALPPGVWALTSSGRVIGLYPTRKAADDAAAQVPGRPGPAAWHVPYGPLDKNWTIS